ncbi:MAG: PD-(D/E)XK nuclease family protein [Rhodocyclaceae bacterium]
MPIQYSRLALDGQFLDRAAAQILQRFHDPLDPARLASLRIIVPNLLLAPPLTRALARSAGDALLLPVIDTLPGALSLWQAGFSPLPDSRRQLMLHSVLRRNRWFDSAALWDVAAELTGLFDELTEQQLALPADEEELAAMLARGYEMRASQALAFEARVAHTLWMAESQGRPSRTAARLLAAAQWADDLVHPLCVIAEQAVGESGPLARLIERCASHTDVWVCEPDRATSQAPTAAALMTAWPLPAAPGAGVRARALGMAPDDAARALSSLRFMTAASLEALAEGVVEQVCQWLDEGRQSIALIAADRLAARRTRALLERRQILVEDETGWKLSTTRAAACVDAWIEVLSTDGYHRAVVDLIKSPFVFADLDMAERGRGILQIERQLARAGITSGLDALLRALQAHGAASGADLIERLQAARRVMPPRGSLPIHAWLAHLHEALGALGASESLRADVAGAQWWEWHRARSEELAGDDERFDLTAWRIWFNREMDAALFRDRGIESPIVMTHLAATRLRAFDAAIVIGADTEHLRPPQPSAWLAHEGVRRELGLPGQDAERQRLREDLAGLVLCSGQTMLAWQSAQRDEHILPAPDVELLMTALTLATGRPVASSAQPAPTAVADSVPTRMPMPAVPTGKVPARLSASGLRSLLACPYQYFARYVLGLEEVDEVREALEKRDFGEFVHRILQNFHGEYPRLLTHDETTLVDALARHSVAVFEPLLAESFLNHAWLARWQPHLADYVVWAREREQAGWLFATSESERSFEFPLLGGLPDLQLYGRIDRVDTRGEALAVLDYKTRTRTDLKRQAADPDDVQLAFYTLLEGEQVEEAAYVALDDDLVATVPLDAPHEAAEQLAERIGTLFADLHRGAGMPANGHVNAVCGYCAMRGLCRKDWHE